MPFKIDLSSNITSKPSVKQVEKTAAASSTNSNAGEVLALQTTIKRLTKQLARVKKEKNLAADLLDRRAREHEDELKKETQKLERMEKKYLVAAEVDKKKIHSLIESNYELSERVKELDDKLKETTELALALHENGGALHSSDDEDEVEEDGIGDSDFPLTESEYGSPKSSSDEKLDKSGGSEEPFRLKPLKFDDIKPSSTAREWS